MSFHEKSNLAMLAISVLVYVGYFLTVIPPALAGETSIEAIAPLLFGAVAFLVIAGIAAHVVIAVAAPRDAEGADERDKLIEMRADARSSHVVSVMSLLALCLALLQVNVFWIVHAILAGLVLSEIAKGVLRAIDYRRGV